MPRKSPANSLPANELQARIGFFGGKWVELEAAVDG